MAQVRAAGLLRAKRFPLDTPIGVIRQWRETSRRQLRGIHDVRHRALLSPVIRRSEVSGYCYLYAMQSGQMIKFGRSADPEARLKELQTHHPLPLTLLVSVPCHMSLESAVLKRFAADRINGEWFHATVDVMSFIAELQLGSNPVALLWESMSVPATVSKPINHGKRPARWRADVGKSASVSDEVSPTH